MKYYQKDINSRDDLLSGKGVLIKWLWLSNEDQEKNKTETLKETWNNLLPKLVVTYGDGDHRIGTLLEDGEAAER